MNIFFLKALEQFYCLSDTECNKKEKIFEIMSISQFWKKNENYFMRMKSVS